MTRAHPVLAHDPLVEPGEVPLNIGKVVRVYLVKPLAIPVPLPRRVQAVESKLPLVRRPR